MTRLVARGRIKVWVGLAAYAAVCLAFTMIAGFVWPGASPSALAAHVWVESWRHETSRPLIGVAAGDLTGDGRAEVIALIEGSVVAYALTDEGPRFLAAIEGIPESPTAVGVYPYEPGGPLDVWIGTQSPGIVYVYRYDPQNRSFRRLERIRYAWTDVERVIPLDFDGIGFADVAVVTKEKELVLFRWTPVGHERVDLDELEKGIRFIEAIDVTGDSREELIVARGGNHLAVIGWQPYPEPAESETPASPADPIPDEEEMFDVDAGSDVITSVAAAAHGDWGRSVSAGEPVVVWENYVWGTHLSLLVDSFRRGRPPEIVSVTSQKVAHHFAPEADGFAPVRLPVDWPSVAGGLIGTADIDDDGVAEILEATATGLNVWSISSAMNREESIELSRTPVFAFFYEPPTRRLIVAGRWGFALWRKEDENFVNVISRGVVKSLKQPSRFIDGMAYLSVDDWADLLGVRLRYEAESGRISGLRGFRFLVGRVGENQWIYDGRTKQTASRPLLEGDVLYLGADFASVVGVDVYWEPFTRTLVVDP